MSDRKVLNRKAKELLTPKNTGVAWEDRGAYALGRPPAKQPAKYKGWDNAWISISFYDGRWHDIGRACTVGFGLKPTKNRELMEAQLQKAVQKIVKDCLMRKGVIPMEDPNGRPKMPRPTRYER